MKNRIRHARGPVQTSVTLHMSPPSSLSKSPCYAELRKELTSKNISILKMETLDFSIPKFHASFGGAIK